MSVYARRGLIVRLIYLAAAIVAWPVVRGRARWRGHAAEIVLCYHNVLPKHTARFERQMRIIRERVAAFGRPARAGHRPAVALTFDDAFADLQTTALPVLVRSQLPATLFAVSRTLGQTPGWAIAPEHPDAGRRTMDAQELRHASELPGITIGSHTETHPDLTTVDANTAMHELIASRKSLEALLGQSVRCFAFPHGRWSAPLLAAARVAGYRSLAVLEAEPGADVVRRVRMEPDVWPIEFRLTVDGAYAWLPGLRRRIATLRPNRQPITGPAPIAMPRPVAPAATGRRAA